MKKHYLSAKVTSRLLHDTHNVVEAGLISRCKINVLKPANMLSSNMLCVRNVRKKYENTAL